MTNSTESAMAPAGAATDRRATIAGSLAAAATAAPYATRIHRGLSYDSAATVGYFIRTPSLLDPFRRQVVFNNHPLFSFAEHVVYTLSGSHTEATLRTLPILFASLAVGLLVWAASRRFGLVGGLVAGVVFAGNTMVASESREVRGYSLLLLFVIASTLLVGRLLDEDRAPSALAWTGYVVAITGGLVTHLYMAPVLVLQATYVICRRPALRPWLRAWTISFIVTAAAYVSIVPQMLSTSRGHHFYPTFPLDLAKAVGGGTWPAAAVVLGLVAFSVYSLWAHPGREGRWHRPGPGRLRAGTAVAGAGAVILLFVWLILRPFDLYSRFFIWMVPGIAWLAGAACERVKLAVPLVIALVVVAVAPVIPGPRADPLALRAAVAIIQRTQAAGGKACVLGLSAEPLQGYLASFPSVLDAPQVADCTVAISLTDMTQPSLIAAAEHDFPHQLLLPAQEPGIVFYRGTSPP
jgi:alkylhydroperoxidase family enzyme